MFLEKIKIFSKFKKHNQSFFSNRFRSNSTILVEFNDFKSSHIPISYLSNFLSKKFKANIVGYYNYYGAQEECHKLDNCHSFTTNTPISIFKENPVLVFFKDETNTNLKLRPTNTQWNSFVKK